MKEGTETDRREGRYAARITALATVLAAAIGAASGYFTALAQNPDTPPTTVSPTTVSSRAEDEPETVELAILPQAGPLPRCMTVTGTAIKPKDMTVWIAFRKEDPKGTDYFGLQKALPDPQQPDRWRRPMELGQEQEEEGTRFRVYAFALHEEASKLLESVGGEEGYFFLRDLPVPAAELFERDATDTKGLRQ